MNVRGRRPAERISPLRRFLSSGASKVLVSVALIAWIAWRFRFGQVIVNMWRADKLMIAGAVLLFMASGVLGAAQWRVFLRFHGVALEFGGTVARYFMGLFFNFILPGFVGGDMVRVYKTAMVSGKATQSFSSTLADRVIGLFVLVLFSLAAFVILPSGPADRALPAAVVMFGALGGFIVIFAFRRLGNVIAAAFGRFTPGGIGEKIAAVYDEMHILTRSPGTLVRVFALSCTIQIARIGVHFLCARAVGIQLGLPYFALFVPVMEIAASLPLSFGGVGVREMVGTGLFALVGVPGETVVSYTLLAYSTGFLGSLPGAAAFVFGAGGRR
jgi:glycosyltransferase 2 family protein